MSPRNFLKSFVIAGSFSLLLSAPVIAADYVSVVKDGVNVRTGPGTNNPVYMELPVGYPLKVLKRSGEWTQISDYEGDTGWIHKSLIGKNDTVIINAKKSVNMRSEPSTDSHVVADVERGVMMKKLDQQGKWLKLRHSGGTVGWIYKPLLWP